MQRWCELDQVLATGLPAPGSQQPRSEAQQRDFICAMENVSRRSAREAVTKLDLSGCKRLLDLGGGPGTAALTFVRRNPELTAVVFDLPGPIAIAREQIALAGLEDRVTTLAGDFFADDLGSGYDVIYLSNIIHSLDAASIADLMSRCLEALEPGGRLVVKDFFLADDRISPRASALFSINMLVHTPGGRSYTVTETRELLVQAGFERLEECPVARHSVLVSGFRPAVE
jgi:cyclopropane fatty-acyl-phospholipid synthase-like methyltransferase